jgi:VWFA-related protein
MPTRSLISPVALLVLLGLLGALTPTPAPAQQQPSPLPGVFGEVLDVRVVNLEVVVTDKNGIPIAGLGPQDFRLIVDGEEVEIDYFSEVRGGVAVREAAEAEAAVPGVPQLAPGSPVETSYLVFIDDFFSVSVDRNRVLDSLAQDLALVEPEDRMAVVAFDGRELEMLTTWTSSVDQLERVFERAKERPAWGLQRVAERRQARLDESLSIQSLVGVNLDEATGFRSPLDRTYLEPQERFYVERLAEQLDKSVAAAAATLRSFAKPPGRKVMLILSGGWPFFPVDYLYSNFNRLILDRQGLDGDDLYGRLVDTANLLGYTLYPIDVPGLDRETVDGTVDNVPDQQLFSNDSFLREQEVHFTLKRLAETTGGRAFINANRLNALEQVVSDTRTYYWLGFTPARQWDDQRHDVKIELTSPEFRVRSREGFLDSSRQREVTMAVESTLLFGNAKKAGRKRLDVPLTVVVPLDTITFIPSGENFVSQLELRIAVVDEDGLRAEIPIIPIALQTPTEPEAGQLGRYETSLRLRNKDHQAVVALYDTASGKILSSSVAIPR